LAVVWQILAKTDCGFANEELSQLVQNEAETPPEGIRRRLQQRNFSELR
jgi:hypothetical protein